MSLLTPEVPLREASTAPDELRSEWVTLLAAGDKPPVLVGFDSGATHDGTLRLRRAGGGAGGEGVAGHQ